MTCPGKYNFSIKQGSSFTKNLTWEDDDGVAINLTGYKGKMQIRRDYDDLIYLTLTTENSRIVITPAEGKIKLQLTKSDTQSLDFSKAIYDLDIYNDDNLYTLIEGTVTLIPEVTKNV